MEKSDPLPLYLHLKMTSHPIDLANPGLPDADDLRMSARPVTADTLARETEWPDSGPSRIPDQPKMSPFGAKLVAAMTGASATSLLSMFSPGLADTSDTF
jgi:hypothetical protein